MDVLVDLLSSKNERGRVLIVNKTVIEGSVRNDSSCFQKTRDEQGLPKAPQIRIGVSAARLKRR